MNPRLLLALGGIAAALSCRAPAAMPTLDMADRDGMSEPKLDFFAADAKGFPTVVHVYGSGWHSGSAKSSTPVAEALQRHGIGCVLVSHRLAPAHSIREQAEDVAAAFAWSKSHVAEKGGNPQKIYLCGHRTGGHLVMLVDADPAYLAADHLSSADITVVIGLSAPVDLVPHGDGHGYGNLMSGPRGKGVFPSEPAENIALSPLHQLAHKLPRTLLLVGSDDIPMLANDARAFADKAKTLGTDITIGVISGKDHMGVVRGLTSDDDPVSQRVLGFIQADPKGR